MSNHYDLYLTKRRLTEWGHWCYQIVTMGLGYSHQSLISKAEAAGGQPISCTSKILVPNNERAEEVNALIEHLAAAQPEGEGKPEWSSVIRIHYTMQYENNRMKIQASPFNERTYYRYLRDAQIWLSHQLMH